MIENKPKELFHNSIIHRNTYLTKKQIIEFQNMDFKENEMLISEKEQLYIDKIIKLSKKNSFELLFITIPVYDLYYQKVKNGFKRVNNQILKIIKKHQNVKYFDINGKYNGFNYSNIVREKKVSINQHLNYKGGIISSNELANFIKNNYKETNIEIFNLGAGNSTEQKIFNELPDSNSSTFNLIDQNSSYFKRKNKILSFFFKKKFSIKKNYVSQIKLSDFIDKKNITKIDILKIDTEGYEYEVIKGLEKNIKIVNFIYFEHHYDNMIKKNYKFSEMHDFLSDNDFYRVFKVRMPFRKSFDYIYRKKTL